jgi:hypothetical protein
MRRLPGEAAFGFWFDQPDNCITAPNSDEHSLFQKERKRVNFLRSLADVMTQLETVQFAGIGMLMPDYGSVLG